MMALLARVAPVTASRVVVWCSTICWGSRSMATEAMDGVSWHSVSSTLVILPSSTVIATVTVPCMPTEEPSKTPDAVEPEPEAAVLLAAVEAPVPQADRSIIALSTPARIRFFITKFLHFNSFFVSLWVGRIDLLGPIFPTSAPNISHCEMFVNRFTCNRPVFWFFL